MVVLELKFPELDQLIGKIYPLRYSIAVAHQSQFSQQVSTGLSISAKKIGRKKCNQHKYYFHRTFGALVGANDRFKGIPFLLMLWLRSFWKLFVQQVDRTL
jgi:hypothetical protein